MLFSFRIFDLALSTYLNYKPDKMHHTVHTQMLLSNHYKCNTVSHATLWTAAKRGQSPTEPQNWDVSIEPLTCPLTRSLATPLALHCFSCTLPCFQLPHPISWDSWIFLSDFQSVLNNRSRPAPGRPSQPLEHPFQPLEVPFHETLWEALTTSFWEAQSAKRRSN